MDKKQTLTTETVGFATIPIEAYNEMLIESAKTRQILRDAITITDGYTEQPQLRINIELLRGIVAEKLANSKFGDNWRLKDDYVGYADHSWCFEQIQEVATDAKDNE